ncbi:NADH-quinone oxidoreductase subunit N [bacterium]|nr:NADH-quinone oxidoreductase subunit N [bacterium]
MGVSFAAGNILSLLPVGVIVLAALLLVLLEVLWAGRANRRLAGFGGLAVVVAGIAQLVYFPLLPSPVLGGALRFDGFAAIVALTVLAVLFLTLIVSPAHMARMGLRGGEYYALLFLSASGMMLLPAARGLVSIIICIELLSLPLYVLAGYNRRLAFSREAGFKYFLLGAFASAFMIYAAFIWGTTGTLSLGVIAESLPSAGNRALLLLGLGLLLVGFAFKAALAPFHAWVPDVYEGSPTPVTGFMAAAVKVAVFAVFLRVLMEGLMPLAEFWRLALYVLAIITMCLGNLLALHQMSLKRLLAYSAITHAGYLVLGLIAANAEAVSAVLFYLIAYSAAVIGSLALVAAWATRRTDDVYISDLRGMAERQPLAALALTFFMLSLIGFPITAGFVGKVLLFYAAYKAGYIALLIIAIINTMVSVYYYLRVVQAMYFLPREQPEDAAEGGLKAAAPVSVVAWPYLTVALISAVAIVVLGLVPRSLLVWLSMCSF